MERQETWGRGLAEALEASKRGSELGWNTRGRQHLATPIIEKVTKLLTFSEPRLLEVT